MKRSTNAIRTHIHSKQLLLFLIAVVLPCSVLIGLTWQLIGQQQELSIKRRADDRLFDVSTIGTL